MKKDEKTELVLVTDHGYFKAFRLERTERGTPHLELIVEETIKEAHERLVDRVTDLAGRHGGPVNTNWGAPMGHDDGLRMEVENRVTKRIASFITEAARQQSTGLICLIAPPDLAHALLRLLPVEVKERIRFQIELDLVKADQKSLLKVLKEYAVIV